LSRVERMAEPVEGHWNGSNKPTDGYQDPPW
jgi:hypothetical protein